MSFVRRGTRLQGRRQAAWEEHAERWALEVPRHVANTSVHPDYVFDAEAEFGRTAPLIVEIGSGLGDAVCHAAEENPDKDFLAVEVYTRSGQHADQDQQPQTAQRPGGGGERPGGARNDAPGRLRHGTVGVFPDPWHKSRHHKRRLIQPAFADLAARAIKPGGPFRIATDWSNYAVHVREVMAGSAEFENCTRASAPAPKAP